MADVRNPFRKQNFRDHFDHFVRLYRTGSPILFEANRLRRNGTGMAANFWRGFDGPDEKWSRLERMTLAWAEYRAGRAVAEAGI